MALVHRFRPLVTKENITFDALYGVESDEISKVVKDSKQIFDNEFIQTANLEGIERFEKIYEINSNSTYSTEERRNIVYNKMVYKPPFTRQRFRELLKNIVGNNNFSFEIKPEDFTVIVSIPMTDRNIYSQYVKRIREIVPANLLLILSTPYTYLYLTGLNYGELTFTDVGTSNGDYNFVDGIYKYVGPGNGSYTMDSTGDITDEFNLCHYTYRELSKYSIFDRTIEMYAVADPDSIDPEDLNPYDIAVSGLMTGYVSDREGSPDTSVNPSYTSDM